MKRSDHNTLKSFQRQLFTSLTLRRSVLWMTWWFLAWGVITLVSRIGWRVPSENLTLGWVIVIPIVLAAMWVEWKNRPDATLTRAKLDRYNALGGMYLESESLSNAGWQTPSANSAPKISWKSGRPLSWLSMSAAFVAVCLLIPDRFTAMADNQSMDLGYLVSDTHNQIEGLEEESILNMEEAENRKEELKKIEENAKAQDPGRTWEALDQLQKKNEEKAREAAEEMISKLQSLAESETMLAALDKMESGSKAQNSAMEAISEMLNENMGAWASGLTSEMTPNELADQIKKALGDKSGAQDNPSSDLSKEDLEKLLESLRQMKSSMNKSATKLANLKLIDLKKLSECKNAGECKNPNALAAYLAACKAGDKESAKECLLAFCRNPAVNRGPGAAPMIWGDESDESGVSFKEDKIQGQPDFSQAEMVGVSLSAPEVSDGSIAVQSGALNDAQAGGGSANAQVVLPRYQSAVKSYFNRSVNGQSSDPKL